MTVEYRRLTEKELDTFIEMRINQLREEGAEEDFDLRPALEDYYHRHMADGTFVSWLAVADGRIVGTSGMSFVEKPPYFVQITASDMGVKLYTSYGFVHNGNFMQYKL